MRSRVTLARIDAAAIDRHVASPLTMRRVLPPPTKSQLAVDSTRSGATPRPSIARRAASRWASDMPSSSHSSLRRVADRPRHAPVGDAVEQRLALALGEHLRVADLVDPPVPGQHRGADRSADRPTSPRPTSSMPTTMSWPASHSSRSTAERRATRRLSALRSCGAVAAIRMEGSPGPSDVMSPRGGPWGDGGVGRPVSPWHARRGAVAVRGHVVDAASRSPRSRTAATACDG